ncbi:MAG: SMP-30/gluconolactonase/LRE family protein, partial [Pseudomonadota bacterium]
MGKVTLSVLALIAGLIAYLLFWPVPIRPEVWDAPPDPGFTGEFEANQRLANLRFIDLPEGEYGPEDVALGPDGRVYMALHSGKITALDVESRTFETVADTGGRPLGIEFDSSGLLWIADAYGGL